MSGVCARACDRRMTLRKARAGMLGVKITSATIKTRALLRLGHVRGRRPDQNTPLKTIGIKPWDMERKRKRKRERERERKRERKKKNRMRGRGRRTR